MAESVSNREGKAWTDFQRLLGAARDDYEAEHSNVTALGIRVTSHATRPNSRPGQKLRTRLIFLKTLGNKAYPGQSCRKKQGSNWQ